MLTLASPKHDHFTGHRILLELAVLLRDLLSINVESTCTNKLPRFGCETSQLRSYCSNI